MKRPKRSILFRLIVAAGTIGLLSGAALYGEEKREKEKAGIIVRAPYWLRAREIIEEMPGKKGSGAFFGPILAAGAENHRKTLRNENHLVLGRKRLLTPFSPAPKKKGKKR